MAGGRALAFVLALLAPSSALAAIGAAEAVVNRVAAHLPGQDRILRPEDAVFQDEVIETGEKSASKLLFRDATQMKIGPNSRVTLDEFVYSEKSGQKVAVSLAIGVMRFTSGKLTKSAYTIRTPTATVGIRGTEFDVIVDENGATTIVVYSGEVLMQSQDGVSTTIGVCGVGMTSPEGQTLTAGPIPANELHLDKVSQILEMDQLLEGSVKLAAAGVGDCLEPAGPGNDGSDGESGQPFLPQPQLPSFIHTQNQQNQQPQTPAAPQPWIGVGALAGTPQFSPPQFAPGPQTPPTPIVPRPNPIGGGPSNGQTPGGQQPSQGPGDGGTDPANPPGPPPGPGPTTYAYTGLAFDAQPSQAHFGFTRLTLSGADAPTHALAPILDPSQAPIGQLSYDLVVASGGSIDNIGGLDGARLEFNESAIDFIATAGGGNAQLVITGGTLALSYVEPTAFNYAEVELPFGFGTADPRYALDGVIEFTLLDETGTAMSGFWEIVGIDRETGLPYNALSVGTQRDGGEFDLSFFLSSLSSALECNGCDYQGMQLAMLFAGWGAQSAPVNAPGGAWLLLVAGFGFAARFARGPRRR